MIPLNLFIYLQCVPNFILSYHNHLPSPTHKQRVAILDFTDCHGWKEEGIKGNKVIILKEFLNKKLHFKLSSPEKRVSEEFLFLKMQSL